MAELPPPEGVEVLVQSLVEAGEASSAGPELHHRTTLATHRWPAGSGREDVATCRSAGCRPDGPGAGWLWGFWAGRALAAP
jgi:hypothetical protein